MSAKLLAQIEEMSKKQKTSLEWLAIMHRALSQIAQSNCFFEESQELQHIAAAALSQVTVSAINPAGVNENGKH